MDELFVKLEGTSSEIEIKEEPLDAVEYIAEEQNIWELEASELFSLKKETNCGVLEAVHHELRKEERESISSLNEVHSEVQSNKSKSKVMFIKAKMKDLVEEKNYEYEGRLGPNYENIAEQLKQRNRGRVARSRAMQTEQECRERLRKDRERKIIKRAAERLIFEVYQQELKKNREKTALKRAQMTIQQRLEHLKRDRERKRQKRLENKVQTSMLKTRIPDCFLSTAGKFDCDVCEHSFDSEELFKKHYLIHLIDNNFSCKYCEKKFHYAYDLAEHELAHTEITKPFKCQLCLLELTSLQTLLDHYMNEHKNFSLSTRIECEICNKVFWNIQNYLLHLKNHKKILHVKTPFLCEVCGKIICTAQSFQNHTRIHTGEKPFVCSYCGRSFRLHNTLKVHMHIHTGFKPYRCNECGKAFYQRSHLVIHSKIHSGDKPFICTVCGKCWMNTTLLKKHMKTHLKL